MDEARSITRKLVDARVAACANLLPITSIYRWQGIVQEDQEVTAIFRTSTDGFNLLREEIMKGHSYEIPCIVAWDIIDGYPPYLNWIDESL